MNQNRQPRFTEAQKSKHKGWVLTEGRIPGEWVTPDPTVAQVVAALEAIRQDMENPYVVLESPKVGDFSPDYCQTVPMDDSTYRCEIRLFGQSNREYRHYNLMRPDEQGFIGTREPNRPNYIAGYDPDLATLTAVFTAFIANPAALPAIPGWQWLDITDEINAIT